MDLCPCYAHKKKGTITWAQFVCCCQTFIRSEFKIACLGTSGFVGGAQPGKKSREERETKFDNATS